MDFSLTKMQLALRKSIIEFSRNELNNDLIEIDNKALFQEDIWRKISELDLIGLPVPEKYGGHGESILTTLTAIEALGYACKNSGLVHALITQILCALQISLFGDTRQMQKYLPAICKGEIICAQAITEPEAGSDANAITTTADRCPEGYTINGTKIFISNGPIADLVIVFAVTNHDRKSFGGISCFLVEKQRKGFNRSRPLDKMGLRTLQNGELVFKNCVVPEKNLLGNLGQGSIIFDETMQLERTLLFGAHIGAIKRVLEASVRYSNGRHQSGQPIGRYQSISNKIAEIKVNLELGKLILYKSAWLKDQKKRANLETSIAKLFISESLKNACLEAVQIHGAYGYMKEFEIERDLRDSIASTIYSGTSEIQKNIISKLAGLK